MKKVSLFFGMVLAASFAMAQNTATINQTGENSVATILQQVNSTTGNGGNNQASITQVGNKLKESIIQSGKDNKGKISHNIGTNNLGSTVGQSFIVQTGDANMAESTHRSKDGKTEQTQKGNGNEAKVFGSGTDNGPYFVRITQLQEGNSNKAYVQSQWGGDAGSTWDQTQKGNNNLAEFKGEEQGSKGVMFQEGSDNKARVITNSRMKWSNINISQIGSHNEAYAWDNEPGYSVENMNYTMKQKGDYNLIDVNNHKYSSNTVVIEQDNSVSGSLFGNTSKVDFSSNSNKLNIYQNSGNLNNIMLKQGNASEALLNQIGSSNVIGGIDANCQISDWAIFNGKKLKVDQSGDNNKLYFNTNGNLTVKQDNTMAATKDGNTIKYTQTSTSDMELTQVGDKNLIWFKNTSASADLDIDQIGDGNGVASYGNGFAAPATGCATFEGSHLNVDQTGNNNLLHLSSVGANASVDVAQIGNSNLASVSQQ